MKPDPLSFLDPLEAAAREATPGPWRVEPIKGYCFDYIVTDDPASSNDELHSNYVGETGNVAGPRGSSFFQPDARHIATANPAAILSLRPSIEAAIEARVKEEVSGFAMAILHGDDEHRGWLAEAAEMWLRERQVPPPRGKGTSNA